MTKPLLILGDPRTGSTWLMRELEPYVGKIAYEPLLSMASPEPWGDPPAPGDALLVEARALWRRLGHWNGPLPAREEERGRDLAFLALGYTPGAVGIKEVRLVPTIARAWPSPTVLLTTRSLFARTYSAWRAWGSHWHLQHRRWARKRYPELWHPLFPTCDVLSPPCSHPICEGLHAFASIAVWGVLSSVFNLRLIREHVVPYIVRFEHLVANPSYEWPRLWDRLRIDMPDSFRPSPPPYKPVSDGRMATELREITDEIEARAVGLFGRDWLAVA